MKAKTFAKLIVFCFSLSLFLSQHAVAESIDTIIEADSYLKEIRDQLKSERDQLKNLKGTKTEIAAKLAIAQDNMDYHEKALRQVAIKAGQSRTALNKLEENLEQLEKDIDVLKKGIMDGNVYLLDNLEYVNIKLLLFSKKRSSTVKNLEMIELLNRGLIQKLKQINEKYAALEAMRNEQRIKTDDLEKLLLLKRRLAKDYKNEQIKLQQMLKIIEEDEESKKEYMNILKRKRKQFERKLAKIAREKKRKEQAELAENKDNVQNNNNISNSHAIKKTESPTGNSFELAKKKLIWPVNGQIIEKFGPKKVKGFKGTVVNKGIKIRPDKNGEIKSVYSGIVKHRDVIRGFGNILIVQHDSVFYTLYANMDHVHVNTGDKIQSGQRIGTIDVDLVPIPSYLYFEIRKRNTALNPIDWLSPVRR